MLSPAETGMLIGVGWNVPVAVAITFLSTEFPAGAVKFPITAAGSQLISTAFDDAPTTATADRIMSEGGVQLIFAAALTKSVVVGILKTDLSAESYVTEVSCPSAMDVNVLERFDRHVNRKLHPSCAPAC
jgi:hypothetical protein